MWDLGWVWFPAENTTARRKATIPVSTHDRARMWFPPATERSHVLLEVGQPAVHSLDVSPGREASGHGWDCRAAVALHTEHGGSRRPARAPASAGA